MHAPAVAEPKSIVSRGASKDVLWLVLPAALGVVAGVIWWLLAPGGLNLVSGNPDLANAANPDSWLPRDLVLGSLDVAGRLPHRRHA